jgi:hypothetical protein
MISAHNLENKSISGLESAKTHSLAIAILGFVTVARWVPFLFSPAPLFDESIYLGAFRAVAAGKSPYSVHGYYYPPPFAVLGSWLMTLLGQPLLLLLIRSLVVLGLVITVWLALIWWRTPVWRRLVVGAIYLCLAPAVGLGMRTGNISFLIIGAIVLGLTIWQHRPVLSGLVLGSSVAIKPIAPLAILVLLVHRPLGGGYRQVVAGLAGSIAMLGSLFPIVAFLEMFSQNIASLSLNRSISLHRLFSLGGIELNPLIAVVIIAVIGVVVARLRPLSESDMLCIALTAAILSVPLIWTHTLLLTLPVQVLAAVRALDRRRNWRSESSRKSGMEGSGRFELWLVVLSIAAIQLAEGAGSVDRMDSWIQLVALGIPFVSPAFLAGYVLWTSPVRDTSSTS